MPLLARPAWGTERAGHSSEFAVTSSIDDAGGRRPRRASAWQRVAEAWVRLCPAGGITLITPDGSLISHAGVEPGPAATVAIHRWRALRRLLTRGGIGLAEGYMDGDWTTPDLTAVVEFGVRNAEALSGRLAGNWLAKGLAALRHRLRANSRSGSRRNIAYHYDLGNAFYGEWLDETMTYSSALFTAPGLDLGDAQREKYRRIVDTLGIRPGDQVLEIGCGWGGFAQFAAQVAGARVTAITISAEQAHFARERMRAAGLDDRVDIRFIDYRDVSGTFDKIVSIEMLEAVGEEHWPAYFRTLHDRLKPGGAALVQVITVPDERFATYRRRVDFIQRYIFPGGMLLSPGRIRAAGAAAGLALREIHAFGQSYAETLRRWNEHFQARWDRIRALGFDERFRRMWTYYLNSCEACFRGGATDVGQFLLVREQGAASAFR